MVDSRHTDDLSGEDEFLSLLMRLPSWIHEMAEMAQMGTISPDLTYLADRAERIGHDFQLLADSATADVSVRRCAANTAAWLRTAQQLLRNNKDKKTGEELIRLAEIADESDEDYFRPNLLLCCPRILKTSKCCELAAEAATRLLDRPEVNDFAGGTRIISMLYSILLEQEVACHLSNHSIRQAITASKFLPADDVRTEFVDHLSGFLTDQPT